MKYDFNTSCFELIFLIIKNYLFVIGAFRVLALGEERTSYWSLRYITRIKNPAFFPH